jgi:hypothetical protein
MPTSSTFKFGETYINRKLTPIGVISRQLKGFMLDEECLALVVPMENMVDMNTLEHTVSM